MLVCDRDLPVPTSGSWVIIGRMTKWLRFFLRFSRFFENLLSFFEMLHTFSRTLAYACLRSGELQQWSE